MRPIHRIAIAAAATALSAPALAQDIITDDFETYGTGAFPGGGWLDAAEILDEPTAPIPSVTVETASGPDGLPTQAVVTVEAMATSQGLYRFIPVRERYIVGADVRVDQLHDGAESTVSDWTFEVGVGQFQAGIDLCCTPQVGIYGSCFTGGWRLYALGTNGAYADIDLELPIETGRWYRVEMDLDAARGVIRTRIEDAETSECLHGGIHVVEGWTPSDGAFDIVNFFESDVAGDGSTRANVCVLDNVEAFLVGGPCPADFNGDGTVNTQDVLAFLNAWTGGCP